MSYLFNLTLPSPKERVEKREMRLNSYKMSYLFFKKILWI